MPKRALTDRFCAAAKVQSEEVQTDYFDEDTPGLALRVSQGGRKSWTYHFTWAGKRARLTFGTYPAISLSSARTRTDEARAAIETGDDPRLLAGKGRTFKEIAEDFLGRECGMTRDAEGKAAFTGSKLRSGPERLSVFERLIYPELGARPIDDIKRSEIVSVLDDIEDEQGPAAAHKALAFLSRLFNWHASRSDDFRSPIVRGMGRVKPRERARKRILADDEIRDVWAALDSTPDLPECYPRYVRTILLTATRRNEASGMHSTEFEGDNWTIPGERYKTKLDHVIPLTAAVKALIGGKPHGVNGNSWFMFSTTYGAKAFSGYSKAKKALDAEIARRREADGREAMPRWTLHDLRRTARSLMSRAKVPSDHAERVLGHVIGGVRETYDRYEYLDEKREALVQLARLVDWIVHRRILSVRLVRVAREAEASAP